MGATIVYGIEYLVEIPKNKLAIIFKDLLVEKSKIDTEETLSKLVTQVSKDDFEGLANEILQRQLNSIDDMSKEMIIEKIIKYQKEFGF